MLLEELDRLDWRASHDRSWLVGVELRIPEDGLDLCGSLSDQRRHLADDLWMLLGDLAGQDDVLRHLVADEHSASASGDQSARRGQRNDTQLVSRLCPLEAAGVDHLQAEQAEHHGREEHQGDQADDDETKVRTSRDLVGRRDDVGHGDPTALADSRLAAPSSQTGGVLAHQAA